LLRCILRCKNPKSLHPYDAFRSAPGEPRFKCPGSVTVREEIEDDSPLRESPKFVALCALLSALNQYFKYYWLFKMGLHYKKQNITPYSIPPPS
jgi:hypothetical protein